MEKMNCYWFSVCRKDDAPCFVVAINHAMTSGVYFFKSNAEARAYIDREKLILEPYGKLEYSAEDMPENLASAIRLVLEDNDIKIGKNGRTYSYNLYAKYPNSFMWEEII